MDIETIFHLVLFCWNIAGYIWGADFAGKTYNAYNKFHDKHRRRFTQVEILQW